jgi:hypothetical protein
MQAELGLDQHVVGFFEPPQPRELMAEQKSHELAQAALRAEDQLAAGRLVTSFRRSSQSRIAAELSVAESMSMQKR